jgi:LPXTG-site transpeptidase (sortase) family protein
MERGALAASARSKRRGRRRALLLAFAGVSLMGIVSSLSVAFVAVVVSPPSTEEAVAPASIDVSRFAGDPGAIYDRTPVTPTPSPVPAPASTPAPPPLRNAPFRMVIDSIGVNAPVVPEGLDANMVPIVPLNAYEVAWYTFSAQPGTGSNAVFAGHVTWSGRAVFYSLDQLAAGDTVKLIADNGNQLVYAVTDSYMVDANDTSALSVMAGTSVDVITIITCDGAFYSTGDPVFGGDYTNRRVIRASLAEQHIASAISSEIGQ